MIASGKGTGEEITSSPLPGARSSLYLEPVRLKRNLQIQGIVEINFPNVPGYGQTQEDIVQNNVKSLRRYGENCSVW